MIKNILKAIAAFFLLIILIYCALSLMKYGFITIIYIIVMLTSSYFMYYLYKHKA